jgi:hypothetical protein
MEYIATTVYVVVQGVCLQYVNHSRRDLALVSAAAGWLVLKDEDVTYFETVACGSPSSRCFGHGEGSESYRSSA